MRSHAPAAGEACEVPPQALHLWELVSTASTPLGVVGPQGDLVHANAALEQLNRRAPALVEWLKGVSTPLAQRTSISVPGHDPVELYLENACAGYRLLFAWIDDSNTVSDQDPLTGVGSRARFERLMQSDRYDALLLIDLDRFKQVNDTLGHGPGDQLLKLAAKRIIRAIRSDDPIVRLGGDEFAIFHTVGEGGLSSAVKIAERVIKLLSGPFLVDQQTVHVGASVGIATLDPAGHTSREELYRHADLALYAAKASGGSRLWCFERELEEQANERRALESDLRQALLLGQLKVYYQPQVTTDAGDVRGVEALLRWEHPERGTLAPEEFVPVAEEIGEIGRIGAWVLRSACAHASRWPGELAVAVNVAARQIEDPQFLSLVEEALNVAGLDPARLELEVTESVLMANSPLILERLRAVKELGVSVTLDEFGTGFSSLSYLNRFPFSRIKIARSFIQSQQHDARARNLVKCVLAMGDSLGISTLASGVDTQEQCDALVAIGCREGQGWLFGKPLTREGLDDYLRQNAGAH